MADQESADKVKRKPTTPDELKADIEGNPDRGTINGVPIIRAELDEIRVKIPKELHREFLIWAGLTGKTKSSAVEHAITVLLSDPGVAAFIARRLAEKAELHETTVPEVRNGILGHFKKIARQSRAKLTGVELDIETDDRLDDAIDDTIPVDSMPTVTKDYGLRDDGRTK